jgi:exodeoxyribonuclease-1
MAYVFYDFETTGRDAYYDQIIRFAAARTDGDFQILERFETECALLDSVVPCPTHIRSLLLPAAQLEKVGLPSHYTMVRSIQQRLSKWSPTLFLSNEAIAFGEHAFRQALYKTLHNPYLTNTNGNCRTDVTRLVQATFVHLPDALTIPRTDRGRADFDLERLAAANGFTSALALGPERRVNACIFLCRLIEARAPEVWSMSMHYSKKASVENFVRTERVFALSDVYNGRAYRWLTTVIGENPDNASELLAYSLAMDPEELAQLSDPDLEFRLDQMPRPLRRLKSNGCPMLAYPDEFPVALADDIDMAEIERRAEFLRQDASLRSRLVSTFYRLHPKATPPDYVEHLIYEGFFPRPDEARMTAFHEATSWMRRYEIANEFEDDRLRTIALRLVHAEDPAVIPPQRRRVLDRRLAHRVAGTDVKAPWRNLRTTLNEFDALLMAASAEQIAVLEGHRLRLRARWDHSQTVLG